VRIEGVCNGNPETVVWSHANGLRFDKGIARKALDHIGAYACSACHAVYDRQAPRPKEMTLESVELDWWRGHGESLVRLYRKGLL
jgi:Protein of unknown function (DUF1364)